MDQTLGLIAVFVFVCMTCASDIFNASMTRQVLNYKDPLTGCEYLYTRSSDMVPRESGDGISQLGCYNNDKGVLM